MAAIMMVLALPPREFCNSIVNTESRYGTRTFLPPPELWANAEMQLPSDERDKLMALPSFNRAPVAPVPLWRSDPARSIKLMMAT